MPIKAYDTLLAIKVLNLVPNLRQSDRQVGVVLIEHFNRKSGRCDPGLERIASLLGCCTRTVMRATERLEKVGLFRKVRHGGYSGRNSYEPNWTRLAQQEAAWKEKFRTNSRALRTEVSPETGQQSHSDRDQRVTQTFLTKPSQETLIGLPRTNTARFTAGEASRSSRPSGAANLQAERRWSDDLLQAFKDKPVTYGEIVELIDETLAAAATSAELARHGAGIGLILQRLNILNA